MYIYHIVSAKLYRATHEPHRLPFRRDPGIPGIYPAAQCKQIGIVAHKNRIYTLVAHERL